MKFPPKTAAVFALALSLSACGRGEPAAEAPPWAVGPPAAGRAGAVLGTASEDTAAAVSATAQRAGPRRPEGRPRATAWAASVMPARARWTFGSPGRPAAGTDSAPGSDWPVRPRPRGVWEWWAAHPSPRPHSWRRSPRAARSSMLPARSTLPREAPRRDRWRWPTTPASRPACRWRSPGWRASPQPGLLALRPPRRRMAPRGIRTRPAGLLGRRGRGPREPAPPAFAW